MQTDIAVHDADQKQRSVMNINLKRCRSRKERQMNAITKRTSVAVLVTLGITLSLPAAEPPKPQAPAGLDKAEGDGGLVADWLQADGKPLGPRVVQEIGWAREMAERIKRLPGAPDLSAELAELDRLARPVASPASAQPPAVQPQVKLPDGLVGRWVRGDLDGTNYLNVGTKAAAVVAGNYTLCAWIRTTSDSADVIGNGWPVTAGRFLLRVQGSGGATRAYHGPAALNGRTRVNDGKWHHVAQVVDGGTLSLIVDGKPDGAMQLQGAQTSDKPPAAVQPKAAGARKVPETKAAPPSPVTIGSRGERASTFEGELDEVCVFDRALSVEEIAATFPAGRKSPDEERFLAVRAVKRAIMLKHPAIDFTQLLFIDQPRPRSTHEAQHRNGSHALPGGRLLVQEGLNPDSPRRQLAPAPAAPGAAFWRPDLSFDARTVLFCMRPAGESSFHLYEIGFDGTGLRQLTNSRYDDLDPIYLPDGHIMFSTGRAHTYIRCMPETPSYVLARCDADGRNIHVISRNNECDWTPALLPDGRVLYTRWEYTDKPLWRIQSLWTINQDGTGEAAFWGNQSVWPDTLAMARPIPGTRRVMFVGVGHHNWFAGSVGIVDPDKGYDYPDGLTRVTMDVPWAEVGPGPKDVPEAADYHTAHFDAFHSPWPLSEDLFLVSAKRRGEFSLYLMDIHGNRELIAKAAGNRSILHAMPVRRRSYPRQPDQVSWPDPKNPERPLRPGILFSPDVYEGVPELPRGIVKRLRVIQQDHKTYATRPREGYTQGPAISAIQADSVKRVLGTVPVAEDGSVAFEVPPGRALFFQLLDDKGRAVQTMRSFTGAMPGEIRGCRGCHEARTDAPPVMKSPRSLNISAITPPPWGTNVTVGYPRFVQPVIDKHCVSCHTKEEKARDALDLTPQVAPRGALTGGSGGFPANVPETYFALINNSNGWPRSMSYPDKKPGQNLAAMIPVEEEPFKDGTGGGNLTTRRGLYATLPPMTYLSCKSRLIDIALSGKHHGVKITGTELEQLIAWVDCNVPFRGDEEVRAMPQPHLKSAPVIDRFKLAQDPLPVRP